MAFFKKDITEDDKTLYDAMSEGLNSVLVTMSGVNTDQKIKVVDNIISFIGICGGVGTSTIVANLARLAEKKGMSVLIIDMNILYPAQNVLFRIEYKDRQPDIVSFLTGEKEIGECLVSKTKASKISILSAHDRQLIDYITCDKDTAARNMEKVLGKIKYEFDLILIDTPNNVTFDPISSTLYMSDSYYVVWDESVGCVTNYDSFTKFLNTIGLNSKRLKAIINKRTNIYYPKKVFKELDLQIIGTLPFETSVIDSSLKGEIYVDKGASFSNTAKSFMIELDNILDTILELGGYTKEEKASAVKPKKDRKHPKIAGQEDTAQAAPQPQIQGQPQIYDPSQIQGQPMPDPAQMQGQYVSQPQDGIQDLSLGGPAVIPGAVPAEDNTKAGRKAKKQKPPKPPKEPKPPKQPKEPKPPKEPKEKSHGLFGRKGKDVQPAPQGGFSAAPEQDQSLSQLMQQAGAPMNQSVNPFNIPEQQNSMNQQNIYAQNAPQGYNPQGMQQNQPYPQNMNQFSQYGPADTPVQNTPSGTVPQQNTPQQTTASSNPFDLSNTAGQQDSIPDAQNIQQGMNPFAAADPQQNNMPYAQQNIAADQGVQYQQTANPFSADKPAEQPVPYAPDSAQQGVIPQQYNSAPAQENAVTAGPGTLQGASESNAAQNVQPEQQVNIPVQPQQVETPVQTDAPVQPQQADIPVQPVMPEAPVQPVAQNVQPAEQNAADTQAFSTIQPAEQSAADIQQFSTAQPVQPAETAAPDTDAQQGVMPSFDLNPESIEEINAELGDLSDVYNSLL